MPSSNDTTTDTTERMYLIQNTNRGPLDLGFVESLDRAVRFGTSDDDDFNELRRERIAAKVTGAADVPERDASFIEVSETELELLREAAITKALFDCKSLSYRGV